MGLFDKIKNALFEEEYVEVEEKPKKPKKEAPKSRDVERPIAKKVVLPEKKEVKVEELEDDELLDEDFEIKPKAVEAPVVEEKRSFKVMDDEDFKVEERSYRSSEPKIVKVIDKDESVVSEEVRYYQNKKEKNEKNAYGISDANKVSVPEYGKSSYESTTSYSGAYERKEDRTHFKPSPIISPIYGILDKNYKKEDVVSKKEVRLTSSYARENLSVEDVRKKAYGNLSDDIAKELDEPKKIAPFEVANKVEDDANLLVDLSDDEEKPSVKEVTMGDALEYFEDLGLEYNVDYVDANKPASTGRRTKENYDEDVTTPAIISKIEEPEKNNKDEIADEKEEEKIVKEENEDPVIAKAEASIDSEDNLFDLIDSMYKEND